jgi:hypothetical protein
MIMTARSFFYLALFALFFTASVRAELAPDPKLALLAPLINEEWTGMMKAPDESAEWKVECRYEAVWNGKVIKYTRTIPTQNSVEEGYIYWDDIAKKMAFFTIYSSAVFASGFVSVEKNIITFEGKMTWPAPPPNPGIKQSYDFRNTFEMKSATEMVDRWFQNAFGPWRPGHVIEFHLDQSK